MNVLWLSIFMTQLQLTYCMDTVQLIPWSEAQKREICLEMVTRQRMAWERDLDIIVSQRRMKDQGGAVRFNKKQ